MESANLEMIDILQRYLIRSVFDELLSYGTMESYT